MTSLDRADALSSSSTLSPSAPMDGDTLRAWLQLANLSFSPRLMTALLVRFGKDPLRIFSASDSDLDTVNGFQARHLVRLRDPAYVPTDRQIAWVEKQGVRLALWGSPEYPEALEILPDAPPLLFVRGTLETNDSRSIGIVGSRHATPYGKATSERLARELAEQGVTVVSGGAVGIDASAHRGAISGGGRTLAFLGCGLDVDYPRENRQLFEQILAHGALISENPLGAQPESWRFPARNRLISAMSLGVLVVEAPRKSGALITANFAADQGRTVMAVPGNIDRPSSEGCNDLLKDGAHVVTEIADILQAVGLRPLSPPKVQQGILDLREAAAAFDTTNDLDEAPVRKTAKAAKATPDPMLSTVLASLSPIRRQLMEALTQSPQHIDQISQRAGVSATEAGVEMIFLELDGLVRRLPGNTYLRTIG